MTYTLYVMKTNINKKLMPTCRAYNKLLTTCRFLCAFFEFDKEDEEEEEGLPGRVVESNAMVPPEPCSYRRVSALIASNDMPNNTMTMRDWKRDQNPVTRHCLMRMQRLEVSVLRNMVIEHSDMSMSPWFISPWFIVHKLESWRMRLSVFELSEEELTRVEWWLRGSWSRVEGVHWVGGSE